MQVAPAVRAALGEEFGNPIGTRVTGKMFTAMKRLGVDKAYDVNFGADLTIIEEGTELLNRIKNGGKLPMITSCSPGWIRFAEFYYPDFLDNLSTCKSPLQMQGAITKTYYAQNKGIDPKDIVVVSVMPCVSKKTEAARDEMVNDGLRNVDYVLTTRELARMIKQAGIDFNKLPESGPDMDLLGEYTGAAVIFGATGGVMEAALRTVADILEEKRPPGLPVHRGTWSGPGRQRGGSGHRRHEASRGGRSQHRCGFCPAGCDPDGSAPQYHFIEIMGCPGGCVTGGGQPQIHAQDLMDIDVAKERAKALYEEDTVLPEHKSHHNKQLQELYKNFLGEANGHKSHELLHTHYHKRAKYPDGVLS
jgi:NADH-quinone oxidoreductase subunit G/NADP-reducing hydrogenase subunit HndD